jgi:hypothetical protein
MISHVLHNAPSNNNNIIINDNNNINVNDNNTRATRAAAAGMRIDQERTQFALGRGNGKTTVIEEGIYTCNVGRRPKGDREHTTPVVHTDIPIRR